MSDNGACPFDRSRVPDKRPWDPDSYWTYSKGWAHVGNTPFRLYKQNQHEGGIRSPMIISWPAGLKTAPGSISQQRAHIIDIMATCLDVTKANYPTTFDSREITPLQGKSLLPILHGEQRQGHNWLYFQFAFNRAIIQGETKLVSQNYQPWELYNLTQDPTEVHNLIDQQPEKAEALKDLWRKVAKEVDQLPEDLLLPLEKAIQVREAKQTKKMRKKNKKK